MEGVIDIMSRGPEAIFEMLAIGMFRVFAGLYAFTATGWMQFSSVELFLGNQDDPNSIVNRGQDMLRMLTYTMACISTMVAIIKIMLTQRAEHLREIVFMVARVVISTGAAVAFTMALLKAGDEAGPWLASAIPNVAPGTNPFQIDTDASVQGFKGAAAVGGFLLMLNVMPWLILVGIINFLFVIGTYVIIAIVLVTLPLLAGTSATEAGKARFDKAVGWLVAASLYKIAAGIVWGVVIAFQTSSMFTGAKGSFNDSGFAGAPFFSIITGLVGSMMAIFILPTLIRLAVPAMAGASGLGAGKIFGTVAVTAGLAAGAVATGGALAGAGAAGSAGAGTAGASGATGAAAQTGTAGAAESTTGGGIAETFGGGTAAFSGAPANAAGGPPKAPPARVEDLDGGISAGMAGPSSGSGPAPSGDGAPKAPPVPAGSWGAGEAAPTGAGGEETSSAGPGGKGEGPATSGAAGPSGAGQQASQFGYMANTLASETSREFEEAFGEGEKV